MSWSSSKTDVAVVDVNGKVNALKAGTAVITVNVDGKKADCTIIVYEKEKPKATPTPASGTAPAGTKMSFDKITMDKTSLTLDKGNTSSFKLSLNGVSGDIYFKIADESVVNWDLSSDFIDENECENLDSKTLTCWFMLGSYDMKLKGLKSGTTMIDVYFNKEDICIDSDNEDDEIEETDDEDDCNYSGSGTIGILVK